MSTSPRPTRKVSAAKTAAKTVTKTATAPVKTAAPAAKPAPPVRKATASPPAAAAAAAAKPAKLPKPAKKPKQALVRDSFTMPEDDFALIATLKKTAMGAGREAKKSELLRAGLQALAGLKPAALTAALDKLVAVKQGRPRKGH